MTRGERKNIQGLQGGQWLHCLVPDTGQYIGKQYGYGMNMICCMDFQRCKKLFLAVCSEVSDVFIISCWLAYFIR